MKASWAVMINAELFDPKGVGFSTPTKKGGCSLLPVGWAVFGLYFSCTSRFWKTSSGWQQEPA